MKPDGTRNKLPRTIEQPAGILGYNAQDAWRVFGIMSEFVAASEKLDQIRAEREMQLCL